MMSELILKKEFIENWIKILLIISPLLILISRFIGGEKFQYLIRFWDIQNYFSSGSGSTISNFTRLNFVMLINRIIILSLFLTVYFFPYKFSETQFNNFIFFTAFVLFYLLTKYLLEKLISIMFKSRISFFEINKYKIGLKNLISIHFYIYLILLLFNPISAKNTIVISFSLFVIYIFFTSSFIYKKYSDNTLKGLVYFILYLCAFEIAPAVVVMLEAFKNN